MGLCFPCLMFFESHVSMFVFLPSHKLSKNCGQSILVLHPGSQSSTEIYGILDLLQKQDIDGHFTASFVNQAPALQNIGAPVSHARQTQPVLDRVLEGAG